MSMSKHSINKANNISASQISGIMKLHLKMVLFVFIFSESVLFPSFTVNNIARIYPYRYEIDRSPHLDTSLISARFLSNPNGIFLRI